MNRRLSLLIGMVLCSASARADDAASPETLEAVEQKIVEAWNRHTSVHARVYSLVHTPGADRSIEVTGTMDVLRRSDGLDLVRNDTTRKTTLGSGERSASTFLYVLENFDGLTAYQLVNLKDDRRLFKIDPLRVQRIAGSDLFVQLRADNQLALRPSEKIGDRPVFVIEATPTKSGSPVAKLHVYVDQEHGVATKITLYDRSGAELRTVNLFELEFDKGMTADLFKFDLPTDLRVIDQTASPDHRDNADKDGNDQADVDGGGNAGNTNPQPTPAP